MWMTVELYSRLISVGRCETNKDQAIVSTNRSSGNKRNSSANFITMYQYEEKKAINAVKSR